LNERSGLNGRLRFALGGTLCCALQDSIPALRDTESGRAPDLVRDRFRDRGKDSLRGPPPHRRPNANPRTRRDCSLVGPVHAAGSVGGGSRRLPPIDGRCQWTRLDGRTLPLCQLSGGGRSNAETTPKQRSETKRRGDSDGPKQRNSGAASPVISGRGAGGSESGPAGR
jgi:hypothetical protein